MKEKFPLSGLGLVVVTILCIQTTGCIVAPPPPPGVAFVDDHGYRHEGYYDDGHHWHGGYRDEHGNHHDDPADWHH